MIALLDNNDSREETCGLAFYKRDKREQSTRVLGRQNERNVIYIRELEVYLKLRGHVTIMTVLTCGFGAH